MSGPLLRGPSADGKLAPVQAGSRDSSGAWMRKLGPGLITGAADDDPSGIAAYSQAGAQFGFGMLWTLLFTYPLMMGIQIVSARIGRVTGKGLAANIRMICPAPLLYVIVGLLLFANTINIAADVAAMGDAVHLAVGGPAHWYAIGFGLVSVLLQVFIPYTRYVRVLKWLTLALFAYVGTIFAVDISWHQFFVESAGLPRLPWSAAYITTIVAVFGTTISPYLFFWQASQEVEELRADPAAHALKAAPQEVHANFTRIKVDTCIGMAFSNLIAFFIMLTTAVTLHAHGISDIQSSAQAASALRPVAGQFAFLMFSLGIVGTGMLAIPVLAGSAAYAVSDTFNWRSSLEDRPSMAPRFYAIIAVSTIAGVGLIFAPVDPIKALYWSAVINGFISIPIMAVMMLMSARQDVMGSLVLHPRLKILGWTCTAVMACAVAGMLLT